MLRLCSINDRVYIHAKGFAKSLQQNLKTEDPLEDCMFLIMEEGSYLEQCTLNHSRTALNFRLVGGKILQRCGE